MYREFLSWTKKNVFSFMTIALFLEASAAGAVNSWPCFHGPTRDSKSTETGLLKKWPESGPKLAWEVSGLGERYSSVSIAGGHVYTAGTKDKQAYVFAFDINGKPVWKTGNGQAWETDRSYAKAYTGSRGTPTYDDGVVYHLGETGLLAALDAMTGKELWALDIREKYAAPLPDYGFSESVLIDGDRLFCSPAGKKGFIVCLNKKTGALLWSTNGIKGTAAFNSPILADFKEYHILLSTSSEELFGVDAKSGKLLWSFPLKNARDNNIPDPIFYKEYVFASSGYGRGSLLLKLAFAGTTFSTSVVWDTKLMDNHHGGVVLLDGYLYGSGHESKGWFCLDFMTGKERWKTSGKGSLVYADGMFYMLEEKGAMKLVRATSEKYDKVSSFNLPSGGKGMYWAHPVVCDGRLYVRHGDKLFVYEIK
jgi:outer membrane protein assembly factor BamB